MDYLDLSNVVHNGKSFDVIFDNISNQLINESILVINNTHYRICEIEYYLKCNVHDDPYVHGDPHQKTIGKWYFHRHGTGTYKGGTFKGMDLTFGYSDGTDFYGGILIRSIQHLRTKKIIEGPCNVVTLILKQCNVNSIGDLTKKYTDPIPIPAFDNTNVLYIAKKTKKLNKLNIFTAPRVGLGFYNSDTEKLRYIMKNYRYLVHPNKIKKNIYALIINLYHNGKSAEEISTSTLIKVKRIEKYISCYDDIESDKLKDISKKTKNRSMPISKMVNIQRLCYEVYG